MIKLKCKLKENTFLLLSVFIFLGTCNLNLFSQDQSSGTNTVTGVVVDSEGEPLIGVSVQVQGTNIGTVTNIDGEFRINMSSSSGTLTFNYLGYLPTQLAVTAGQNVRVNLTEGSQMLDEIVVVAYGTQRKKDLTGAVGIVDTESMQKLLTPSIGEALQGQAAGVSVNTSGAPGSTPDIRIRGVGSFSTVGPLYVIDGLIMDGSQRELNVNDIESMQVLKDASATALYGSRGANGVILITTKRGKDGPTRINASVNFGIQQIAKKLDMMNSIEYLRVSRQAYENADMVWPGEPEQGQVLVNTDWQDEFFKTALTQDYNFSVSGGNQHGNYMISLNYYNQDGVVKGPTYERYNVRSNTEARKGNFTFGQNLTFGHSETQPLIGSPFVDLVRMPPVIPVYEPDGSYGFGSAAYPTYGTNPIGLQETRRTMQKNNRLLGNAYIQYEPIPGLRLKSDIGVEYFSWYDKEIEIYKQIRYQTFSDYENQLLERRGDFYVWTWENTAFYEKKVDLHKFDVLLGYTATERKWAQNVGISRDLEDGYWVLDNGSNNAVNGTRNERAMASFLGRINYDYAGKYLLQFNIRNDKSSRFGKNYRSGTFPSGSLGWRVSEENFFNGAKKYIDDLKLRVSYGKVGDQQALGEYEFDTYINFNEGGIFGRDQKYYPGSIQKGRANPDIRWETKTTFNAGVDFTILSTRLYGTVEYYNSDSKDLLLQVTQPWVSGTDINPWANYGRMTNRGFEITLGYRETQNDFKYNIALNMTTLKNKVTALTDEDPIKEGGLNNVNRSEVGRSIGDFYVLRTDGIFQSLEEVYAHTSRVYNEVTGTYEDVVIQPNAKPGDIRYKDINGDGTIDSGDREYVGSPLPNFEFGLNFSAEYKNFDFNLFIAGVTGNKIYNNTKFWLERMDEPGNYPKNLNPWSPTNPSTTTPRPLIGPNDNTLAYSDRWIEKGDYLRLKNIQVGYTLPSSLVQKTNFIEGTRVYVGAQNLFTITGYSGFDPEISGGGVFGQGNDDGHFPPVRTYVVGLQLSF